jgi:hypothetical protein
MARLNGRSPVEIKLPDLLNQSIPIYDLGDRLWNTINVGDIVSGSAALSGSNTFNGNQIITGSLDVSQSITGSIITGAFVGDGSQLTNIPLSGVTGADSTRISDGNATASISDTLGLRINTNTEITGSLIVSSGSAVFDSALQLTENSSLILNSGSNLYVYDGGIISGTFKGNGALLTDLPYATTGSNTFVGNQIITGSVFITQDLTVLGSSSIVYVTSSQLDIATNIIKVNAANPGVRYGGLAVVDSGSNPQVSGSFLFDSQKDEWIFVHQAISGSPTTSSAFLLGPETYDDLGNEIYITQNRIPKGTGIEHLNDSNITDTGTVVSINSNTEITGGLNISGSINIGQFYTVPQVITGAVDITGSLLLNGSEVGTGKLDENQFNNFTASYKTGSFTGSFIGDGSGLYNLPISGITGLNLNDITGSLNVSGSVTASFFVGDGSQLTNLPAAANVLRISGSAGDNTIVDLLSSSLYITGSGLVTASLSNGGITIDVPVLISDYDGITKKHTQSVASTMWTFSHYLGERYPSIEVFDSNGYVVIPTNILAVDQNTINVYFSSAQSGTVTATVGGGLPAISASFDGYLLRTDGISAEWQSLGELPFATTGSNQFISDQTITGSVKIKNAKMDATCSVMSTSGTVISATGYDGANFDYVVKNGSNMRFGNIMAIWSGASVKYSETSTTDLGDTSDVTFTVSNTGDLNAVIASGTWTIEVMYRALGCISGIEILPTPTVTPSANTPTPTPTVTPSANTPTPTPTVTPSANTPTPTPTNTVTPSVTPSANTPTPTATPTRTPTTTYTVGQTALGGIIAYILQPGDPGYEANVQHGLVVSSSELATNQEFPWGCQGTLITGANGTFIGTGYQNTLDIIAGCPTEGIAAKICREWTGGGYTDWYLPSKMEISVVIQNYQSINAYGAFYMSSTEYDADNAWAHQRGINTAFQAQKSVGYNIRAVRSF